MCPAHLPTHLSEFLPLEKRGIFQRPRPNEYFFFVGTPIGTTRNLPTELCSVVLIFGKFILEITIFLVHADLKICPQIQRGR